MVSRRGSEDIKGALTDHPLFVGVQEGSAHDGSGDHGDASHRLQNRRQLPTVATRIHQSQPASISPGGHEAGLAALCAGQQTNTPVCGPLGKSPQPMQAGPRRTGAIAARCVAQLRPLPPQWRRQSADARTRDAVGAGRMLPTLGPAARDSGALQRPPSSEWLSAVDSQVHSSRASAFVGRLARTR